jgi:glycosyltransferase involved in cell wall biosynthesis
MRIAIEAQRIFRKNKHGMDFVALESIRELQKIDLKNEYFIFVAPGEDICLTETPNFHIIVLKCPTYPLWEQFALPRAAKKVKADILHCTSNTAPVFCKVPIIVTLHDIIFLEKKKGGNTSFYQKMGWYYRKLIVPPVLKRCKHIITVSKFECEHILETLKGLPKEKITAVYNGYNSHFKHIENYKETTRKYFTDENYFFFLGNTDPKKNTQRILKAYSMYAEKAETPIPLIVADLKSNVLNEIIINLGLSHVQKFIKSPGYIANTDLPAIYSGATAFIYASLRESFGIPILESMACGTPVITSDTSAMPEIASDAAILVNPYDEIEITYMLLSIQNDNTLRSEMREKGYKRVKFFSWRETAKETLKLYYETVNP